MARPTDRRNSPRYTVQLPCLHKPMDAVPARPRAGWTRNLSEGGICLELVESVEAQTPLHIRLRTDQGLLETEVQVIWTGRPVLPSGGILHGVAFTQAPTHQLRAVQDLLVSNALFRPAGVRLPFEVGVVCGLKSGTGPALDGGTRNIGRGGALVRLPQILSLGTAVELTLRTSPGPLTAEGTVVWVAPPEGRTLGKPIRHGLRFTAFDWVSLVALAFALTELPKKPGAQGNHAIRNDVLLERS